MVSRVKQKSKISEIQFSTPFSTPFFVVEIFYFHGKIPRLFNFEGSDFIRADNIYIGVDEKTKEKAVTVLDEF